MSSPRLFSSEGLARASAQHPWRVIGVWLAVLVASGALIATLLSSALTTEFDFANQPESKRAMKLLEALTGPAEAQEVVIVRSDTLTVDDPAFREYAQGLFSRIMALGPDVVQTGFSYYLTGQESMVSGDRKTTLMSFRMAGSLDDAARNIDGVLAVVRGPADGSGFRAYIVGDASLGKDWREVADKDMKREMWGVVVAVVVLLAIFAAVVASAIPLVLAAFSIAAALALTALIGLGFQFSFFVTNMITMMGLAVGIDYSLFILSRFREERQQGREKLEAIARAGATASRAVFFSGVTVVIALVGMLIIPSSVFRSLAGGAILVVMVSVAASLTLLPAVLGLLGDRVNAWRLPWVGRRLARGNGLDEGGFWDMAARTVMRRPMASLALTGGLLSIAAIPAFGLNLGMADFTTLPDSVESKEPLRILDEEFAAGMVTLAQIVVSGDVNSPALQAAGQRLAAALAMDPAFGDISGFQASPKGDLALITVPMTAGPNDETSVEAVRRLRDRHIPEAFAGVEAEVLVTGATAFSVDFFDQVDHYTPIVFAFVLGLSFLLLMVVFRSLVVPVKAIIMNLLSVGAAYGLMVVVFERGVGAGVLGFRQIDTVEAWIPLFLFSVLFGLSMDYHVFLLSRIREHFDLTGDNNKAVAFGLRTTGRIITGAAIIMVAVFAGFASGDLVMFQQVGFGLAVAVFLDATVVRSVLVPATMRLLGTRNWYLPKFLEWLPRVRAEG